jgi:hypothetical protein
VVTTKDVPPGEPTQGNYFALTFFMCLYDKGSAFIRYFLRKKRIEMLHQWDLRHRDREDNEYENFSCFIVTLAKRQQFDREDSEYMNNLE